MSVGSATSGTSTSSTSSSAKADPFSSLNMSDFLNLMITELQNQDPSNPIDDSQIMQEIGQMQSIESTTRLDTTLNALSLSQGLSAASAMINQNIVGLDNNGNTVNGTVSSVLVTNGTPSLVVGNSTVSLSNVSQVL
jgi:flagellar basal-body rod modification protein FlgD